MSDSLTHSVNNIGLQYRLKNKRSYNALLSFKTDSKHRQTAAEAGAAIDLGYGNEVHFLSPRKLKLATAAEFNEYIDFIC